jgi:hypothetical protein
MNETAKQMAMRARLGDRRRGVRMNSRVPVALAWKDDGGSTHRDHAHTRIISPYGCLVVFPRDLELEQKIEVVNLASQQSNPAIVVWRGKERPEGYELGIELLDPEMGFWGLEL